MLQDHTLFQTSELIIAIYFHEICPIIAQIKRNVTVEFLIWFPVDQGYEDLEPASDYVEVEDELPLPAPPQPTFTAHYTAVETKSQDQDAVSEDYDDVEDPVNNDGEDYDDVG